MQSKQPFLGMNPPKTTTDSDCEFYLFLSV